MKSPIRLTIAALILIIPESICQAQMIGFGGPSALSRAGSPLSRSDGSPLSFRPYLGLGARYDTNIGSIAVDDQGNLLAEDRYGGHVSWGVYGVRRGKRNLVGLNYRGHYRLYTRGGNRQGIASFVTLNYVQQVSRRTDAYVSAGGGTYAHSLYDNPTPLLSNPLEGINDPLDEGFDSRTGFISGAGGLTHMLSNRLSFNLMGQGFYVRRESVRLIDAQGYITGGNLSYQLGRTQSITGSYNYLYFFFPGDFGESRVHLTHLRYQHQLSAVWNLNLQGGVYRLENRRLIRVPIDPILAAITGQRAALEAAHNIVFKPSMGVTLGRKFERAYLSFYYHRGVTPGNGFMTTSERETAGTGLSYTATDRLNVGLNFSAQRHSSLAQDIGRYTSYGGSAGINYRLWRFLHFSTRLSLRRWQLQNSGFDRLRLSAWAGLSLSPGELPLSLW